MRRLSNFPGAQSVHPMSWTIVTRNRRPQFVLALKDGTTMTGVFKLSGTRVSDVDVTVEQATPAEPIDLSDYAMLAREGSPGELADIIFLTVASPGGGYYWWLVPSELAGDPIRTRDHGNLAVPMPDAEDRLIVVCARTSLRISLPKAYADKPLPTADEESEFTVGKP